MLELAISQREKKYADFHTSQKIIFPSLEFVSDKHWSKIFCDNLSVYTKKCQIVTTPSFALKRDAWSCFRMTLKKRKEMVSTAKQWKNWGTIKRWTWLSNWPEHNLHFEGFLSIKFSPWKPNHSLDLAPRVAFFSYNGSFSKTLF